MENKKKLDALQGLRFIAFSLIFTFHLKGYFGFNTLFFASLGVTFFVVISGFFSEYTIEKHLSKHQNEKNIWKQSISYTKSRLKKIYPLYLVTLFLYLPLSIKNLVIEEGMPIYIYLSYFVFNIFLLEAWHYAYFDNLSYAGWYLSILFFLTLITVPLHKLIVKINKNNSVLVNVIAILLLFILMYFYFLLIPSTSMKYYSYVFPVSRIFEYCAGMFISRIYMKTRAKVSSELKYNSSIVEALIVSIVILLCIFSLQVGTGFIFNYCNLVIALIILFVFMYQKGFISKILSLKPLVMLGDMSFEMYLIHNLFTGYYLGILTRILPHNTISFIFGSLSTFIMTFAISYIIHYKKYLELKKSLKDKLIRLVGNFKQKKLKCKEFTIISNNCFGGVFYRNNNLPYMSPTCGLFIMPNDYIKFIYNLKDYLKEDIVEISIEESNYKDYLKNINYQGTIGKLKDIEIMFLHYKNFNIAKDKWYRRISRIRYDRIIYKFNDQNGCTYQNLLDFEKFPVQNKICFTAKKYDDVHSIIFDEFQDNDYVVNDTKEKIFKKYIDMYEYINRKFGDKSGED